jgi:hypothetical protein
MEMAGHLFDGEIWNWPGEDLFVADSGSSPMRIIGTLECCQAILKQMQVLVEGRACLLSFGRHVCDYLTRKDEEGRGRTW